MKLKKKHLLTVLVSLFVITALMAAPTYSWLSSKSDPVVNTFAGGDIQISLDEALVDKYGEPVTDADGNLTGERVNENSYIYLAGATLTKDPTVTVQKGSESCYIYICVVDELTASNPDLFNIADLKTDYWEVVSTETADDGTTTTVYRYKEIIDLSEADEDLRLEPIFTTITVSENLTAEDVDELGSKTITVTSYAVQSAHITLDEADALAVAELTKTTGETDE